MPTHAPPPLTPRQLRVLRLIRSFQQRQCYSATIAELADALGAGRTTVFEHIDALAAKGLLEKLPCKARSLSLTRQALRLLEEYPDAGCDESPDGLRLLGRVAAGSPIEAIENPEPVSLDSLFGAGDTFALEVCGDSMIDEGIRDGDYVVCRKTAIADNGDLVIAILDDNAATLKRFFREPARVRLQPANERYKPIYSDNCRIEAVVVGLVRRL